jgi:plastocyanin
MHCHVLEHMAMGMMGSLLVITGENMVSPLAKGQRCPMHEEAPPMPNMIVVDRRILESGFTPPTLDVFPNSMVSFHFQQKGHTVTTDEGQAVDADPIHINGGDDPAAKFIPVPEGDTRTVPIQGRVGGTINYRCGIHEDMRGTIRIVEPSPHEPPPHH